jgi:hypothetical protein
MFPVFRVAEGGAGGQAGVVGTVTRTTHGRENWIGDEWIGFLKAGAKLVAGRWHRRGDLWQFAPESQDDLDAILAQSEWEVLDGYWGERAEVVLDQTRQWDRARFRPTDAIRIQGPGGVWLRPVIRTDEDPATTVARAFPAGATSDGGDTSGAEVVEAGWDHEHCTICWETLGPGGQADGFVSKRTWVCERCYVDFVEQRSLAFIPSA